MSLVSIIITTWNNFDSLLHSIQSIRHQTYTNFEIIVLDCHSNDPNYYSGHLETIPGLTLIHLPENCCTNIHSFATKQQVKLLGAKHSKGEWICFINDSDYWYPEKLQTQLSELSKASNILLGCSSFHTGNGIYSPSNSVNTSFHTSAPIVIYGKSLGHANYIHGSTCIVHRSIVNHLENWIDLLNHTNCLFISKPLVYINYLRM